MFTIYNEKKRVISATDSVMDYLQTEIFIKEKLRKELPRNLFYHGYEHTLDVLEATERISQEENIEHEDLLLLKTAALFHDSGFLHGYAEHEKAGCKIACETLPGYDYTHEEIEIICGMIMATKIPQNPQTHLEEILCDADLDYLGRNDFEPIAESLFQELIGQNIVNNEKEWNRIQENFLSNHHYFTVYSKINREAEKQKQLQRIKSIVANY